MQVHATVGAGDGLAELLQEIDGKGRGLPGCPGSLNKTKAGAGRHCDVLVSRQLVLTHHGGMSTGPKTPEGRERTAAAQRRRWSNAGKTPRLIAATLDYPGSSARFDAVLPGLSLPSIGPARMCERMSRPIYFTQVSRLSTLRRLQPCRPEIASNSHELSS